MKHMAYNIHTHTPEPWKWFEYPDGRKLLAAADRAVIHCPDAPMVIDEADQRLIAEAPEMYAALKDYLEWGAMTASDRDLFADRFRAVIARVEGRS